MIRGKFKLKDTMFSISLILYYNTVRVDYYWICILRSHENDPEKNEILKIMYKNLEMNSISIHNIENEEYL